MSFWSTVETDFDSVFGKTEAFFAPLIAQFKTAIGPVIIKVAEEVVEDLGEAALGTLIGEGFVAAVESLAKGLLSQGVTVAQPILESALQAAAANAAIAAAASTSQTKTS